MELDTFLWLPSAQLKQLSVDKFIFDIMKVQWERSNENSKSLGSAFDTKVAIDESTRWITFQQYQQELKQSVSLKVYIAICHYTKEMASNSKSSIQSKAALCLYYKSESTNINSFVTFAFEMENEKKNDQVYKELHKYQISELPVFNSINIDFDLKKNCCFIMLTKPVIIKPGSHNNTNNSKIKEWNKLLGFHVNISKQERKINCSNNLTVHIPQPANVYDQANFEKIRNEQKRLASSANHKKIKPRKKKKRSSDSIVSLADITTSKKAVQQFSMQDPDNNKSFDNNLFTKHQIQTIDYRHFSKVLKKLTTNLEYLLNNNPKSFDLNQILGFIGYQMFKRYDWKLGVDVEAISSFTDHYYSKDSQIDSFNFAKNSTVDIDQVTLSIRRSCYYIKKHKESCDNSIFTANKYFNSILEKIIQKIFFCEGVDNRPTSIKYITYSDVCDIFKQRSSKYLRGGHTYMSKKESKRYYLLHRKDAKQGDVMRISIAFIKSSKNTNSLNTDQSLNIHSLFSNDELAFLESYKDLNYSQRVWRVMILVSFWMHTNSQATIQDVQYAGSLLTNFRTNNESIGTTKVVVKDGELFYIMLCVQLSFLEELFSTGYSVDYCFETFGGKSRRNVQIDLNEKELNIESLSQKLLLKSETLSSSIIMKLCNLFEYEFGIKTSSSDNKLIWGVGITYNILQNEIPLFGTINLPGNKTYDNDNYSFSTRQYSNVSFEEMSENGLHYESFSDNEDEINNDYCDETIACSSSYTKTESMIDELNNNHNCQTNVKEGLLYTLCKDAYISKPQKFHICGSIVPAPFTAKNIKYKLSSGNVLTRIQHYYTAFRHPFGSDSGRTLNFMNILGDISSRCFEDSSGDYFRLSEILQDHEKAHKFLCAQNKWMTDNGNGPRVEVAIVNTPQAQNKTKFCSTIDSLQDAIKTAISIVKEGTLSLEMFPLTSIMELFSLTIYTRLQILFQQFESPGNYYRTRSSNITASVMMSIMQEVAAHRFLWFNGRYEKLASNRPIFGRVTSRKLNRPILQMLEDSLEASINNILNSIIIENKLLVVWLYDSLTYYPQISMCTTIGAQVPPILFRQPIIACSICYNLFESTISNPEFDTHFCLESERDKWINRRKLDEGEQSVLTNFENMYGQLDRSQKLFVDQLLCDIDKKNRFLTGMAGSGKSFTLKAVIYALKIRHGAKMVQVVAHTKTAASIVDGITINSFFGIGLIDLKHKNITLLENLIAGDNKKRKEIEVYLKYLFIDEISLISGETLEVIEHLLKVIKRNDAPFGGVKVCCSGDPLQLPPFDKENTSIVRYFFESRAFTGGSFRVHYLTTAHRQKEGSRWLDILNRIRIGEATSADIDHINQETGDEIPIEHFEHYFKRTKELCDYELALCSSENWTGSIINKIFDAESYGGRIAGSKVNGTHPYWNQQTINQYNMIVDIKDAKINSRYDALRRARKHKNPPSIEQSQCFLLCSENIEVKKLSESPLYQMNSQQSIVSIHAESLVTFYNYQSNTNVDLHKLRNQFGETYLQKELDMLISTSKFVSCLQLLKGQTIMFTDNSINRWIANNSFGEILEFCMDEKNNVQSIWVQPKHSNDKLGTTPIQLYRQNQQLEVKLSRGILKVSLKQFPIKSADACTLHSALGMTIKSFSIANNERLLKAKTSNSHQGSPGSVYTFLSRGSDHHKLTVLYPLELSDIAVDKRALAFDKHHRNLGVLSCDGTSDVDYSETHFRF